MRGGGVRKRRTFCMKLGPDTYIGYKYTYILAKRIEKKKMTKLIKATTYRDK